MLAEKVIHALLRADVDLAALVADRIYPTPLPQGVTFPALGVTHIVTTQFGTIDADAPYQLMRARVQVDCFAKDYPTQKALVGAVAKALLFKRGTIAGVSVATVQRVTEGADERDDDMQVYMQPVDYHVTYQEPSS